MTDPESARSARALRHAQVWRDEQSLRLVSGARLPEVSVCYETWGELNDARDNIVWICHALSGDSHVTRHDDEDDPGWWELMVGPGRPIDTDRYFVVCSNVLGGCRGTTGPNFYDPDTGLPYGADFPVVTVHDMVEVQRRLLDHLGVETLRAVVGGSLGGLQAIEWAIRHPERVRGAIAIAAAPRLGSQSIAFDVVGRNAIRHDVNFRGGQYYDGRGPESGLALARMLAHITYLSDESMRLKFDPDRMRPRSVESAFEAMFSVGSYLAYQGDRFVERFDANSYITLSTAMDLFDLGDDPEQLGRALSPASCRWLFLSFSSDWLYPPSASQRLVDALVSQSKPVSYCEIASVAGHDSFLIEESMQTGRDMVGSFLDNLGGEPAPAILRTPPRNADDETSIFHAPRIDYEMILELMPHHASVLDLGCGNGELLCLLRERGHEPLLGVENDESSVAHCIAHGLEVLHADLEQGLGAIPDRSFDVALLSQTLQSIVDVVGVLDELLRVARLGIVSFPNFAHRPMREMFLEQGRLPKQEGFYAHEWYDTPNRRFPSIVDFQELCAVREIEIAKALYVDTTTGREVKENPNLESDLAVMVLSRPEGR